jgi:succinate dehydrogenase / fumarate reductase cytochrome b subunit
MSSTASKSVLSYLGSSVGKKQVMALTGLALCGFLVMHLLGNFLLLVGPEIFNLYAHKLTSNPAIYFAEAGLVILFLMHIGLGFRLTVENKLARGQRYFMKNRTGRGATVASVTMPYTGAVLLVFIIVHLMNFKYGALYYVTIDGEQVRDVYRVVIEYFANPLYVAWYVFAMICMGIHLSHGFQSTFQSLGFNSPKYTPVIKKIGHVYALALMFGFGGLSIWCYFQN